MTEAANISIDDAVLVQQCRQGVSAATESLIRKYQNRIYNAILRICANPDDAAELTQDTFVKVIENIDKFEGRSSFYTWAFRIGVNLTLNYCQRSVKLGLKSLDAEDSFREASYGVGATKWQTVYHISLKTAISGIFTGIIISIGRAAGEAAPILFTAATFYTRGLPTSIFDKVMALPYIIYGLITEGTFPDKQVPIAYGASVILLIIVLLFSTVGIIIRIRIRRTKLW